MRAFIIAAFAWLVVAPAASAGVCAKSEPIVCALRSDGTRHTDGTCEAELVRHATILHQGKCVAHPGCRHIYKPVCASDPETHAQSTYGNLCTAEVSNAPFLHDGKCIGGDVCSDIYKPVCATDPATHAQRTYGNLCSAEHANAPVMHDGKCH